MLDAQITNILCGLALLVAVMFISLKMFAKTSEDSDASSSDTSLRSIRLMDVESFFLRKRSIATVSFFTGSSIEEAEEYYRGRLTQIVKVNPWLAGQLRYNKSNKLCLQYSLADNHLDTIFQVDRSLKVHEKMAYEDISNELYNSSVVGTGQIILDHHKPVFSFVLIPDASRQDGFVVSISLSHVVADGCTYYMIIGMLSPDAEIYSVDINRKHEFEQESKRLMGGVLNLVYWLMPAKVLWKKIFGGKKYDIKAYYVDNNKVAAIKEKVKKDGVVPYVSTLDIVTSHFCKLTLARTILYALNLRSRMSLLCDIDGGNYEKVLALDPVSYDSPSSVRKVIASTTTGQPFEHYGSPLGMPYPTIYESLTKPYGIVSSWNFDCYSGDMSFANNTMTLHIPLFPDVTMLNFSICVAFKASKNRMGVIYVSPFAPSELQGAESPLGGPVI